MIRVKENKDGLSLNAFDFGNMMYELAKELNFTIKEEKILDLSPISLRYLRSAVFEKIITDSNNSLSFYFMLYHRAGAHESGRRSGFRIWEEMLVALVIIVMLVAGLTPILFGGYGNIGTGSGSTGVVFAHPVNSTTVLPYNTSGYVLYTLLLHNNTLFYGNVQFPPNYNSPNGTYPFAMAYDPSNKCIFVTNDSITGSVLVINSSNEKIIADVGVGSYPFDLAYDPANGYIYVTNYKSNTVSVIDPVNYSVIYSINVESGPYGIAYDPANGYIYVVISGGSSHGNVSVIDPSNESVIKNLILTNINGPGNVITYDSQNQLMYVTGGSNLYSISPDNNVTTIPYTISINGVPWAIAYDPANNIIYFTNDVDWSCGVAAFNASSNSFSFINIPGESPNPTGLAYNPSNGYIYVADEGIGTVSVINTSSESIVATISVGGFPYALEYDPANGYMYVANRFSGTLSLISTENPITYYAYYQGNLYRALSPFNIGNTLQEKLNGNGSITMEINSTNSSRFALGYGYTYGKLGNLTNLKIVGSGPYYVDLWFDTSVTNDNSTNGPFFSWTSKGVMSSLGGDTNGSTATSINGIDIINPSTKISIGGNNYTLLQLYSGSYLGINNNTLVGIWVGINGVANNITKANVDPGIEFYAKTPGPDIRGTILSVSYSGNTYNYNYSQLPVTVTAPVGTSVSYSWFTNLSTSLTGRRYSWNSTSGLASARSSVIYMGGSGYVNATYITQYQLTMEVNGSPNAGSVSPPSGWYNSGRKIIITATANANYGFSSWAGSGAGSYSGTNNTATITMNGPISEVANFNSGITFAVNGMSSNALGIVLSVNGTNYSYSSLPFTVYVPPGSILTYSWASNVSGGKGIEYLWQATSGLSTSQSGSIPVNSSGSIIGNYQEKYYLSINVNPAGAGVVETTSGHPIPSGWYPPNVSGQIIAISASGWGFAYWAGSGAGSYTGTQQAPTIYLNGPVSDTANFNARITVSITGLNEPGTAVIINGVNYSIYQLPRAFYLPPGRTINFSFVSSIPAGRGARYAWASTSGISDERSGSIIIRGPGSLVGRYIIQYSITFMSSPNNGSLVSTNYGSNSTPFTIWEPNGTIINYSFNSSFSGGSGIRYINPDPSNGSLIVAGQRTIKANYSTQYYLTTYVNGSPNAGSVSPSSGWYNSGATVTITATSNSEYCFWSWTTGSTVNPTNVVMDGPELIGANFQAEGELWYRSIDYGTGYPVQSAITIYGPWSVLGLNSGDSTWVPPGWYYIMYGTDTLGESVYNAPTSIYISAGGNVTDTVTYKTPTKLSASFTVGVYTYTISGYLKTADNGTALGGRTVNVTFSTDGGHSWCIAGSTTTNNAGYYSYTVNDPYGNEGITNSNASFAGGGGYLGCSSPMVGN